MACDASFLKHYHTPVIHFGTLHFKNKETLYYSAGPTSRYSPQKGQRSTCHHVHMAALTLISSIEVVWMS